jgi:hypothetical protein
MKPVNEHPAKRENFQILEEFIIPGIFLINLSANSSEALFQFYAE